MNLPIEISPSAMTVAVSNVKASLAVHTLQGREGLSELYAYEVQLVNMDEPEGQSLAAEAILKLPKLLGQTLTVALPLGSGTSRYFSGIVTSARRLGWQNGYANYGVTVSPRLWLLGLNRDCRIFQNRTVPDVVKEILDQHDISPIRESLPGKYRKWDCVTQYRESDFDFINRIMAHEGIYYYFEHSKDGHTLVLADSSTAHAKYGEFDGVLVGRPTSNSRAADYLETWGESSQIETDSVALLDYDFRLQGDVAPAGEYSVPTDPAIAELGIYDYPAKCVQQEDLEDAKGEADPGESNEEGQRLAQIRLEERRCNAEVYRGQGTARWLATGYLFSISNVPAFEEQEFLVTTTNIMLRNALFRSANESTGESSAITISAIDSKTPFRAPLKDKPVVWGPQTAVVVGPPTSGKYKDDNSTEIWTDKHGRIRVKFHWDIRDATLERTSCWVRVAHPWAGKRWGVIHIPRVGNEVVVEFLEGDPDRPLVTGSVYNADNMPPYDLPKNKTQSGIKTRSSKDGNPDNFNEIRFEDLKGKEELHIQAEKDMSTLVKANQSTNVGGNRSVTVHGKETIEVKKTRDTTITLKETQKFLDDREMTVSGTNTDTVTKAHTGNYHGGRTELVDGGNDRLNVDGAKSTLVTGTYLVNSQGTCSLSHGKDAADAEVIIDTNSVVVANKGKSKVLLNEGKILISAPDSIDLVCGDASISLSKEGTVTITGKMKVALSGGSGASTVTLDPAGVAALGTMVKINS